MDGSGTHDTLCTDSNSNVSPGTDGGREGDWGGVGKGRFGAGAALKHELRKSRSLRGSSGFPVAAAAKRFETDSPAILQQKLRSEAVQIRCGDLREPV